MATEPVKTCNAKATIIVGRHTEADVECGKEELHGVEPEEAHVAVQETQTSEGKRARIIYLWH
jgi:hypothetical protein